MSFLESPYDPEGGGDHEQSLDTFSIYLANRFFGIVWGFDFSVGTSKRYDARANESCNMLFVAL